MAKKGKSNSVKSLPVLILVIALLLIKGFVYPELDIQAVLTALDVHQEEIVSQIDENFVETNTPPLPAAMQTSDTFPFPSTENILQLHFIDVGQADCIVATYNEWAMMIDAGDTDGKNIILNYLKSKGIKELTYFIPTHPHKDHIGSAAPVIREYPPKTILMSNAELTSDEFIDMLDAIEDLNLKVINPKIGSVYPFGNAEFMVLNSVDSTPEELNNASIVIRLVYGNHSFMLTGDAEKDVEYQMMDSGLPLKSTFLKMGHHGSQSSSLEKFVKAVSPEIAVISVGADNSYGHPHEKIVNRLNRLKIKTYRTDHHGTIVISTDGETYHITTEKEE